MAEQAPTTSTPFGELDGEAITTIVVKASGTGLLDRWPGDGERGILTLVGEFKFGAIKRVNGRLVREMELKATQVSEPTGELADEVEKFILLLDEERTGKSPLPFDEEPSSELDAGDPTEGSE